MAYFKCNNHVKEMLSLEKVAVTCIFSEPDVALAVSIVYIILHYKVLFKNETLVTNPTI